MEDQTGLSTAAAAQRLKLDGYNELPATTQRTILRLMGEVMREPMFALLMVAGTIYLMLGDPGDALMLLAFVFISMGITIVQERRTERVLETLRDLSSPRALVIRDGEQQRIPGREVVVGDLLILEEGDRVAADGALIESHDLLIDESLLTGESMAVAKDVASDETRQVYSGAMVVQGGGIARVMQTGAATKIGLIGRALQQQVPQKSPLQQEINGLVRIFATFGIALSLVVLLIFGLTRHDWLNGILTGITLAMSMLPEEFTVILAVFMALAAWRISRNHVLTRHAPVIEALGSATVLCTDKTGTLTENRMTVSTVVIGDSVSALDDRGQADLPAPVRALLDCAVLASEILPFDPMEKAFQRCFNAHFPTEIARYANWALAYEYPLTHDIKAMTHVWRQADATDLVVATKGAPESIALLCRLNAQEVDAMMRQVETLAVQGMRVLGVARALTPADSRPLQVTAFDFQFLGLVGLLDPVRAAVPDAVRECQQAGIRVVMITGDYPSTALAIARQAGITADQVVTGQQLDTLSATALCALVRDASVYARILPEQKLRMVEAFKTNLEVVAMTGDGVNDAPALKAAHIGISMGERGTDVAREASSLILLDDDFTSIVSTIKLGRRLYDNLRLAMTYLIAAHLPIAGMTLLPLLLGTPLVFAPVHIVFLEMIINPACAIVFESEEADRDIMRRAPRKLDERLFGHRLVIMSALQGLGLLAAVAAVFFVARQAGLADDSARALSFSCLVLGNLGLIVSSRSLSLNAAALLKKPNQAQWWILAGTLCALGLSLSWAPIRGAFHFAPFAPSWLLLPILGGCATLVWIETVKYMYRLLRARP